MTSCYNTTDYNTVKLNSKADIVDSNFINHGLTLTLLTNLYTFLPHSVSERHIRKNKHIKRNISPVFKDLCFLVCFDQ